jgi:tRNA(Arg) A34 adenosine deaminase TadA
MTPDELMEEACRLAKESVEKHWGGPFGAVIVRDGEIVARGTKRCSGRSAQATRSRVRRPIRRDRGG